MTNQQIERCREMSRKITDLQQRIKNLHIQLEYLALSEWLSMGTAKDCTKRVEIREEDSPEMFKEISAALKVIVHNHSVRFQKEIEGLSARYIEYGG